MTKKRLLIIEDDAVLGGQLAALFDRDGFSTAIAKTFHEVLQKNIVNFDLAVIDWHLPDGDGIDLVRRWHKEHPTFPMIMLTARAQITDKLIGLELGANDYITKPFEPLELAARVRRHLSHLDACATSHASEHESIESSGIRLEPTSRRVWYEDHLVEMTKLQYALLKFFLDHPGDAFSRDEILDRVWGYENYPSTRTVDNHVAQLRQMFSAELFETLHGVGYRFNGVPRAK